MVRRGRRRVDPKIIVVADEAVIARADSPEVSAQPHRAWAISVRAPTPDASMQADEIERTAHYLDVDLYPERRELLRGRLLHEIAKKIIDDSPNDDPEEPIASAGFEAPNGGDSMAVFNARQVAVGPRDTSTGIPRHFMSNLIASCAQPDSGCPFDEVSGR